MSALRRVSPTRMNLLRAARRLERVTKGVQLLRRKREALVTELFRLARPAADARARVDAEAQAAYAALWRALAAHGRDGLAALGSPGRRVVVELAPGAVWGVAVSRIVTRPALARTLPARGTPPHGIAPAAVEAASRFETLADLLLEAAPREMLLRRLGQALARTSRQVNMLERRLAPALASQIATVRRTLEEAARDEQVRLRRRAAGTR